ncbi:MAG: glycosyltransferase [Clostridia bacterium]|nr:glycosyltransferase [Clostridia bacterium]
MKYQLMTIGTVGDIAPMTALGVELKKTGARVCLAAFEDHRRMVTDAGLDFEPLPGDLKTFIEDIASTGSDTIKYLKGIDAFIKPIVEPMLACIYRLMANCDAVIFTYFGTFMYSMAKDIGVKAFEVDFIPLANNRDMQFPLFSRLPFQGMMNPLTHYAANAVVSLLERHYIADCIPDWKIGRPSFYINSDKRARDMGVTVLCAFSEQLIPRPAEWGDNVYITGFWDLAGQAARVCDEGLIEFVTSRDNVVYAGFGSMRTPGIEELMDLIASCAGELGLPLVACAGLSGASFTSRADVYVPKGFLNHGWLFSNVDFAIYHGGAGTLASVVSAALPSFVIPFFGDQMFWADMISRRELGPRPVKFKKATKRRVLAGMREMALNGAYRKNARDVSSYLKRENGLLTARDVIIKICR